MLNVRKLTALKTRPKRISLEDFLQNFLSPFHSISITQLFYTLESFIVPSIPYKIFEKLSLPRIINTAQSFHFHLFLILITPLFFGTVTFCDYKKAFAGLIFLLKLLNIESLHFGQGSKTNIPDSMTS